MNRRRPILAACLIVAIFAAAVLGVPGGRVICVGESGHVAVAGSHAADQKHECCCETDGDDDQKSFAAAESDCSDWSLDAQHVEPASQRGAPDLLGLTLNPSAWTIDCGLHWTWVQVSTGSTAKTGGIPRAHLALIAPVVLLI
jgi:hypothetical protein